MILGLLLLSSAVWSQLVVVLEQLGSEWRILAIIAVDFFKEAYILNTRRQRCLK